MGYTLPGGALNATPINLSTAIRQQSCMPGTASSDRVKYHDDVEMLATSYFNYLAPLKIDTMYFVEQYRKQKILQFRNLTMARESNLYAFLGLLCADPAITDVRWAAYMMATAMHEGRCLADKWEMTWAPVAETGGDKKDYGGEELVVDKKKHPLDFTGRPIDLIHDKDAKAKEIFRRYYGRGYVQLTHQDNYRNMDAALNLNGRLHVSPETTLDMGVAYNVMSYGMANGSFRHYKTNDGALAGYKLSDFIGTKTDYVGARKIINGDGATNGELVASYARIFEKMLQRSRLDFLLMGKMRMSLTPAWVQSHPSLLDTI